MKLSKLYWLGLGFMLFFQVGHSQTAGTDCKYPFPQTKVYKHCIVPNHVSREQLNNDVAAFYDHWKTAYCKPTIMPGGYYIEGHATNNEVPAKGTSEGHGFGMITFALMAGYDSLAKQYFDGLYLFFDSHRSIINNELMGWTVAEDERTNSFDCATDGDLDIAYALLLADKQWGSEGKINYLQEAKDMITLGLKKSCVDHKSMRIVLGDWDSLSTATRPSDWMVAQLRAFYNVTTDSFWLSAIDTVYGMVNTITENYSPKTGLMPDFATGTPARPVQAGFLEKSSDKDFSWNACRYPWRIAMDYIQYKDKNSLKAASKVAEWAKVRSENDPSKFTAVYTLDGTPLQTYTSVAFTSPMLVAVMTNKENQEFLNKGWDFIKNNKYKYYNDSINLLCMLVISGNWWEI
ncbi:MAG: chitosanase [Bacteroidales bacterium]|nr:chitosanase [Bacteroidales bacterium]